MGNCSQEKERGKTRFACKAGVACCCRRIEAIPPPPGSCIAGYPRADSGAFRKYGQYWPMKQVFFRAAAEWCFLKASVLSADVLCYIRLTSAMQVYCLCIQLAFQKPPGAYILDFKASVSQNVAPSQVAACTN